MATGRPAAVGSLGRREAPVLGQRDARSLPFSLLFASSAWAGHTESFQARRINHLKRAAARDLLIDLLRVFNAGFVPDRGWAEVSLSGGRLRAHNSTLSRAASGVGELPPSKGKPITGHEAVDVCSAATDRHLGADRIGLPGDAHHWNEEPDYAQASVNRDAVGHCIAEERIGSAPSVSTQAEEISAPRQRAVAHYIRNGGA
jgi:hypothetical protein